MLYNGCVIGVLAEESNDSGEFDWVFPQMTDMNSCAVQTACAAATILQWNACTKVYSPCQSETEMKRRRMQYTKKSAVWHGNSG